MTLMYYNFIIIFLDKEVIYLIGFLFIKKDFINHLTAVTVYIRGEMMLIE